jgi:hypothetical protein
VEAYMAGIDMDVCQDGNGSHEIHDWLFKVISLHLRKVLPNGLDSYSAINGHQAIGGMSSQDIVFSSDMLPAHESTLRLQLREFRQSIFEQMTETLNQVRNAPPVARV